MVSMRALNGEARWFGCVLAAGLLVGSALAGGANADDPDFVMRDGRTVPMLKSESELGIAFRSDADIEAGRRRIETRWMGRMEEVDEKSPARVKILRLPKTSVVKRSVVRQDPAVKHVGTVYRFSGFKSPVVSTGTIVAKVRADLSEVERRQLWEHHGLSEMQAVEGLHDVYQLAPADPGEDGVERAAALAGDDRTLWAQPNLWRFPKTRQVDPVDASYSEQWHLNNTGQGGGQVDADIDAPEAWLIAEGQDILIGMLDDACDVDHEDLRENYLGIGHDPSLESQDPGFNDPRPKQIFDRHGTAVMGLAVARANNLGGRGVAYLSRFTVSRGVWLLNDLEIARAFTFARQQSVDVHINAWGLDGPNPAVVEDAIRTAFTEGRDLDGEQGDDPPLGMIVVFAVGNEGIEPEPGFELSMLPEVIAVGSSNDRDVRSEFSNYGDGLDFLAPGETTTSKGIFTTDNEDRAGTVDPGYNDGGCLYRDPLTGLCFFAEDDTSGKYTGYFGSNYTGYFDGTSASCPIVAGVAALVLSVNRQLTATDVRVILEHTADQINPGEADYSRTTHRSLKYGHGRVNARRAVEETQETLTNGGRTWPDIPANVGVTGTALQWQAGAGTDEFLLLESNGDFAFVPSDGVCYDSSQLGCSAVPTTALPTGVTVLHIGCGASGCGTGTDQLVAFELPEGTMKYFAVYGRSSIGRYSFGIALDSEGGETGSGDGTGLRESPKVTISASPLEGASPLLVRFNGNAVSSIDIDQSRTAWDFDIEDTIPVDARTGSAAYTYIVPAGETRVFTARLTMYDVQNNSGFADVRIRVFGSSVDDTGPLDDSNARIIVGVPGTTGSNLTVGTSPLEVELSVDASGLNGTLQSVVWDLGDGTRATSLVVPHTYTNGSDAALVVPITATITTLSPGGTTVATTATRLLTINPGIPDADTGEPHLDGTEPLGPGGSATACGVIGLIPFVFASGSLLWLRRRRS